MITKFNFSYPNVCKWLGGGVETLKKSYSHEVLVNGTIRTITISSNKIICGWDPGKIVVIGRNMEQRVKPYSNKLSQELGLPVHHIQQWAR